MALQDVHGYDPTPGGLPPQAAARILGIQAQLWTEYVTTPDRIEYLTYPRLCALADNGWSGPTPWTDSAARLRAHTARLDALQVTSRP